MIAYAANSLFTPTDRVDDALMLIEEGVIVEIAARQSRTLPAGVTLVDFGDSIIVPGFIDIHIHGGAGHDVMREDCSGLAAMERFIAMHGVTTYFPTTVSAPIDSILAALDHIADEIENSGSRPAAARSAGIHLEGPFISHARRGVHLAEDLLPPSLQLFERFWQAARGHIRLMTIAPELEGAEEVIAEARRRGVCVSLGHSDANLKAARAGFAAGATHATHTFNAMRPLTHRDPGIIGEVLSNPGVSADIIADGIHLDPVIVQLFLREKGPEKAVLITDAISATGMPEGRYQLGPLEVEVANGQCTADGKLAGSVLTMDRAVRNVMQFASCDLQSAVRMASQNPATVAGLSEKGTLRVGADADFVVLTTGGEVKHTIIRGVVVQGQDRIKQEKT